VIFIKATGIVRRIDNLGRVVIPKELRKSLRLRENEPLEIFTDVNGEVVLKKYSPVGELGRFAQEYADALNQSLGHTACITDRDIIIAVSGPDKKALLNRQLAPAIESTMSERKMMAYSQPLALTVNEEDLYGSTVMSPIIAGGDIIGSVILTNKDNVEMGQLEQKMCETAAGFLARQLEE